MMTCWHRRWRSTTPLLVAHRRPRGPAAFLSPESGVPGYSVGAISDALLGEPTKLVGSSESPKPDVREVTTPPPDSPFPVDIAPALLADVREALKRYFRDDATIGYSGRFFEQIIERFDPQHVTPWDLAAVSALNVDIPSRAAAAVLLSGAIRDRVDALLAAVPDETTELTDVDAEVIGDQAPLSQLYQTSQPRRHGHDQDLQAPRCEAPRLVPIRDSVVERLLHAADRWWKPMQTLARDPRLKS